jgi:hypothetical protein
LWGNRQPRSAGIIEILMTTAPSIIQDDDAEHYLKSKGPENWFPNKERRDESLP